MYDCSQYANSRLAGTIVRLNSGRPITIDNCESEGRSKISIHYHYLNTGRRGPGVMLTDVDLTPVSLGWADTSSDAAYLCRMPKASDYRQGLRSSNYTSVFGADKRYVNHKNLSQTIIGSYPSLANCLDEAANSGRITALCRQFAIKPKKSSNNFHMYFKWFGVVGDIVNGRPSLGNNFDHLQETLEEAFS